MKSLRAFAAACLLAAPAFAEEHPAIAYRQSLMTIVGANFGPISAMVEGKIPWDDARVSRYGKDLEAAIGLDVLRGFPAGSEGGEAKPAIWRNMDDFRERLETMQVEALRLAKAASAGDRAAVETHLAETGKTCKSCHDEYKEKD